MHDSDAKIRETAAHSLPWVCLGAGKSRRGIQVLCDFLSDADINVRITAVEALGMIAINTSTRDDMIPTVPLLIDRLKDTDPKVRFFAARTLGHLKTIAQAATPTLVEAIAYDIDPQVRAEASESLRKTEIEQRLVIPLLVNAYLNKTRIVDHRTVMRTLRGVGPLPKTLVPLLLDALREESEDLRTKARECLGDMGEDACEALPVLKSLLDDACPFEKLHIAYTLWKISCPVDDILPTFLVSLNQDDPDIRVYAARVLSWIGPDAKKTVPVLRQLSQSDKDDAVRSQAKSAIRSITGEVE
jgi:HEAT repeat protein